MGTGLEAANTNGAMHTTDQKKRIMLGEKKRTTKSSEAKTNTK